MNGPDSRVEAVQLQPRKISDESLLPKKREIDLEWSAFYGSGGSIMPTVTVFEAEALCPTLSVTVITTV